MAKRKNTCKTIRGTSSEGIYYLAELDRYVVMVIEDDRVITGLFNNKDLAKQKLFEITGN